MALRDAGWRVVNLACGMGRPQQRRRREAELREACLRAGFELRLPPAGVHLDSEPGRLAETIAVTIAETAPAIVVSPAHGDVHPAHERVAVAVDRVLLEQGPAAPRWWTWSLWGPPPRPSLATGFEQPRLEEILAALSAHRGELERNDYRRLVRARAEAGACLAPELLFGFGAAAAGSAPLAELLGEVVASTAGRRRGKPRWLDPAEPLPDSA